jgi:hypothetical protein
VGLLWVTATLVVDGVVDSVSVVVDVDRLLADDGNFGAEQVLDTVEITDSWESGKSCLCTVIIAGVCMILAFSDGAIDKLGRVQQGRRADLRGFDIVAGYPYIPST